MYSIISVKAAVRVGANSSCPPTNGNERRTNENLWGNLKTVVTDFNHAISQLLSLNKKYSHVLGSSTWLTYRRTMNKGKRNNIARYIIHGTKQRQRCTVVVTEPDLQPF